MTFWWAQKLIVEYEEARGVRPPGVRRDGTFTVGASKSVGAPVERVFDAFADPALRERWLPGVSPTIRRAQPSRRIRLDWGDGTRLSVQFDESDVARTQVAVEHEKLADAGTAETTKAFWRERLDVLKSLLEAEASAALRPGPSAIGGRSRGLVQHGSRSPTTGCRTKRVRHGPPTALPAGPRSIGHHARTAVVADRSSGHDHGYDEHHS